MASGDHQGIDPHSLRQLSSQKGVANGYASLGADGLVPAAQLPPAAAPDNWYVPLPIEMTPTASLGQVAFDGYAGTWRRQWYNVGAYGEYKVVLSAGTWTVDMLGDKDTNAGIWSIRIDGVEHAQWDQYAGSATNLQEVTFPNLVVAATGVKVVRIQIIGKSISSADYYCTSRGLTLRRTV